MAYESAIWLTGNTTNALTTMSTNAVTHSGVALSPNRLYIAELRVPSLTGLTTDQSLAVVIACGSTAAILSTGQTLATFQTMGSGALTDYGMAVVRVENTTQATKGAVQRRAFRVSEDSPFVRAQFTVAGTTPVAANMSVLVIPVSDSAQ